jgi:hypothetical protein
MSNSAVAQMRGYVLVIPAEAGIQVGKRGVFLSLDGRGQVRVKKQAWFVREII